MKPRHPSHPIPLFSKEEAVKWKMFTEPREKRLVQYSLLITGTEVSSCLSMYSNSEIIKYIKMISEIVYVKKLSSLQDWVFIIQGRTIENIIWAAGLAKCRKRKCMGLATTKKESTLPLEEK